MRVLILAALGLAFVQGRASDAEKHQAVARYVDCLESEAAAQDDGISDARTIATAIAPPCHPQLQDAATVFARGRGGFGLRQRIYEEFLRQELGQATAMVLQHRRRLLNSGAPR